MKVKEKQLALPCPSTAIVAGPRLSLDGSDLVLSMDFDDRPPRSVDLRFVRQRAFRKRSEIYCTEWHIEDAFDTVCEVKNSDWVAELRAAATPDWRGRWVMRHFLIYVDSFGCLEVVAESVSLSDSGSRNSAGT